ncbi:hypothetical protein [Bradyrhizobium iriomotense]|uniref:Uncharacterized protein n=1 Tax=Bradyrhizobium iriomotense TaxID=441950 RepID=A0ABQ6BBW3_9BRAD|nr:hypothetical protein [Bradyrhizobium iriomotense]GLR90991.1 hypothetical protein GCM10007857_77070 [Bradyrhizobium iriomotense]
MIMMKTILSCGIVLMAFGASHAQTTRQASSTAAELPAFVKDGRIGYVMTDRHWAVYQTEDSKAECPLGFNDSPDDRFKQLYSDEGKKYTVVDTLLKREGENWFPTNGPDSFAFKEAAGKIAIGMNLDGKAKDNDFTSPDGEQGIDNQLYRAIGCIQAYRVDGLDRVTINRSLLREPQDRILIEISGVDSLSNDDDVAVRSYRGLDPLRQNATGALPGGTQHIDERWGKFTQTTWKGRIVNGVLLTEPADWTIPDTRNNDATSSLTLKAYRFRLRLAPERAEGLMAGYVDIDEFVRHLNQVRSTFTQGVEHYAPSASFYRAMRRLADGYLDKTGEMTAVSSAFEVKFTQVYIVHPPAQAAARH